MKNQPKANHKAEKVQELEPEERATSQADAGVVQKAAQAWRRENIYVFLSRVRARVTEKLRVDPSLVNRVASGERVSQKVQAALDAELTSALAALKVWEKNR